MTKPFCTFGDDISDGFDSVKLVQLVLDEKGYSLLRNMLNTNISVEGTLFGARTGHHHAEVLLENVTE